MSKRRAITESKSVETNILRLTYDDGQRVYRATYRANGKRYSETFPTLQKARAWKREREAEVARGEWSDPAHSKRLFREAANLWRTHWQIGLKPRTRERYESLLRLYALPAFGKAPIGAIDRPMLQRYINWLHDDPTIAPGTVRRVAEAIRGPLNAAVEEGWIRASPAVGLRLPRARKDEMLFLTAAQVRDLAEAITPQYRTAIYFTAYTGLRADEVWGLRVKDLDLLRRRVHVRQTLAPDGTFGTPKNHEARTVGIPAFLAEMVAGDLARRDSLTTDALVFVTERGCPVSHTNFMRRHFRPAVQGRPESKRRRGTAGHPPVPGALPEELRGLRFHDLRHTAASLMIVQGAHPKAIQERLGHSSITITMDRYGHLLPSLDEALTDGLDAAYHGASAEDRAVEVAQLSRLS